MDDPSTFAQPGDVIEVEDLYELTEDAEAYLASHSLADAPADLHV